MTRRARSVNRCHIRNAFQVKISPAFRFIKPALPESFQLATTARLDGKFGELNSKSPAYEGFRAGLERHIFRLPRLDFVPKSLKDR
jgi:hypothetical protein